VQEFSIATAEISVDVLNIILNTKKILRALFHLKNSLVMSAFIPVNLAAEMNARYRTNREWILQPKYQNANILCVCETFDKDQILTLLNKTGCAKLRIYYGMDTSLKVHAVLCAADEDNADILPPAQGIEALMGDDDYILEQGQRCPEECPPDSTLNTGG
jgi:hypothetical protein